MLYLIYKFQPDLGGQSLSKKINEIVRGLCVLITCATPKKLSDNRFSILD